MSEKCVSVFHVTDKSSEKLKKRIIAELEPSGTIHIHEITPAPFKKRGSLAALIRTAKTVHVCVDRSSVPESEINIALLNKKASPFYIEHNGEIVHSSEFASLISTN